MKKTLFVLSLFLFQLILLAVIIDFLGAPALPVKKIHTARALPSYSAFPEIPKTFIDEEIVYGDGRSELVDKFLRRYNSPFVGYGDRIVSAADKHGIFFGLIPAIAQCESNVGKKIPEGSFNAWGYGIYGEKITRFSSWEEAIETVTKGLKHNYYNRGLDTPEEIMKRYTPSSNGSWAKCVNQYLAELR